MLKYILLLTCLYTHITHARVEARWLSVASVLINDGETKIFFDPAFTRPGLKHWLGMGVFRPDENELKKILNEQKITKLNAVFVTHTHFDHAVDAPLVAYLTGATAYGSKSFERICRAYTEKIPFKKLKPVQIGKFKISFYPRVHSEILGLVDFLKGTVPKNFNFNFYDYRVGESWIYLIEHPEGKILIDTSGDANLKVLPASLKSVDVVFQGVANRKDNKIIINGYVSTLRPSKFIAIHFDYFMNAMKPGKQEPMWNVDFPGLTEYFRQKASQTQFIIPEFGETIHLFGQ